jgi:predicted MPP superfamily phosphohydrolase
MEEAAGGLDVPEGTTVALFTTDLHCNVGMTRVIGAAARATGAAIVFDGGDITMTGTGVERYCVDAYAQALPDGVSWVAVTGNHDTDVTAAAEREAGAIVLDGAVVQVGGLRLVGDADPRHTGLSGTQQLGEEDPQAMGERLSGVACEAGGVDVVLVHDPAAAVAPLEAGCAPFALTGHMHRRSGPGQVGQGLRFTGSSTGRDTAEGTTLGPVRHDAEFTEFRFDQATGRVTAYRVLTVHPDGTVTADGLLPVTQPEAAPAPATPSGQVTGP